MHELGLQCTARHRLPVSDELEGTLYAIERQKETRRSL
jgi:hypothetical protein